MHPLIHTERVALGPLGRPGLLELPEVVAGLVVFVNLPQMDRQAAMDRQMADVLHRHDFGTLLLEGVPNPEVADMDLLGARVGQALCWFERQESLAAVPVGLLGSRAGGAAALIAAGTYPRRIAATVCCGACLGPAAQSLDRVLAPTLLVVAEADDEVLRHNGAALRAMVCKKRLEVIPRATWLFEEPGAWVSVSEYASEWFCNHLGPVQHANFPVLRAR